MRRLRHGRPEHVRVIVQRDTDNPARKKPSSGVKLGNKRVRYWPSFTEEDPKKRSVKKGVSGAKQLGAV